MNTDNTIQDIQDKQKDENMDKCGSDTVLGSGNRLNTSSNCPDSISTWYKRRLAKQYGWYESTENHEKALCLISQVFNITKEYYESKK